MRVNGTTEVHRNSAVCENACVLEHAGFRYYRLYLTQLVISNVLKCLVILEFMSWQENVSLADVLSLRDSCLTEQEIWAVCLECSQSLKSIAHSAIFQTLCITPDTLAFNTNGNVCFMEQISGKYLCFQAICWKVQKLMLSGCSETLYSLHQISVWILIRLETMVS